MSAFTVSIAGFLCVGASVCTLWLLIARERDPVERRLLAAVSRSKQADGEAELATPLVRFRYGVQAFLAKAMRVLGASETRTPGLQTFRQQVILVSLMGLVGGGCITAMTIYVLAGRALSAQGMLLTGALTIGGMWLTARLWLRWHARRWAEQIIGGLVNVLDLWVLCLGAGMSFQASLVRVTEEPELTTPTLREQLELTHQALLAGASREDALRYFVRRCGDLPDVRSLVAHIVHAERLGSSLAQTLKMYAQNLRFKRGQNAREMIQKLPVKLAIPLVFCVLPALLVIIAGPAMLRIIRALSNQ